MGQSASNRRPWNSWPQSEPSSPKVGITSETFSKSFHAGGKPKCLSVCVLVCLLRDDRRMLPSMRNFYHAATGSNTKSRPASYASVTWEERQCECLNLNGRSPMLKWQKFRAIPEGGLGSLQVDALFRKIFIWINKLTKMNIITTLSTHPPF